METPKIIIGIDPGMGGALALLDTEEKKAYFIRLTWMGQVGYAPLINSSRLYNILVKLKIDLADAIFICEDVHVFASDGKVSGSKLMAATSAIVNTLDLLKQSSMPLKSGYRRYEKPDYWRTVSPQKWRQIIRKACDEEGKIFQENTKSGSVRWYELLSRDWKVYQVNNHSGTGMTPRIEVIPLVDETGVKTRLKMDCREAFLIACSALNS